VKLLSPAQVEERLRRDLPVLADDVADRDDDLWTADTTPGVRVGPDPRSRRIMLLVSSAAAAVVLMIGIGVGITRSRDSTGVATGNQEPAPETQASDSHAGPTNATSPPNVVRIGDQNGGDAELLRLRRITDGVEVTIWRWDGQLGDRPPLEPIGTNSGYFAPHPDDPATGSVILPFDGPTLAESSFLSIAGPTEMEGDLRNLAAGINREQAGGQVTYVIAVPETYQVVPAAPE
jgi:hypothetical protein